MRIDLLTIFPSFFEAPFSEGLLARGRDKGLLDLRVHDLRTWSRDRHHSIDDEAYGGGVGMVFMAEPIFDAVDAIASPDLGSRPRMVFLSPQGRRLDHPLVRELAQEPWLLLLTARYEGVDERVLRGLPFEEVSVGDYVVMGGEAPALVLAEAVARFVPGVVGDPHSVEDDSFALGRLDHPHFTRPEVVRGMSVPEVLLSGHHERIRLWKLRESLSATLKKRPDLLASAPLDEEARRLLEEIRSEIASEPGDETAPGRCL